MRFVLSKVEGEIATLKTRTTNREFTCSIEDLILVKTSYNLQKVERLQTK